MHTLPTASAALALWGLAGLAPVAPAAAKDYGVHGTLFPVAERDLLELIGQRLRHLQATDALDRFNADMARRAEANVRRPAPVGGLARTTEARTWTFDPSIEITEEIRDPEGRVIAPAGLRINPLDHMVTAESLVFLDGDDPDQLAWALATFSPLQARLVLVNGAPFDLMGRFQRRFFFDQQGFLVRHFGLTRVPAVIARAGSVLDVREVVPPPAPPDWEVRFAKGEVPAWVFPPDADALPAPLPGAATWPASGPLPETGPDALPPATPAAAGRP